MYKKLGKNIMKGCEVSFTCSLTQPRHQDVIAWSTQELNFPGFDPESQCNGLAITISFNSLWSCKWTLFQLFCSSQTYLFLFFSPLFPLKSYRVFSNTEKLIKFSTYLSDCYIYEHRGARYHKDYCLVFYL